MAGLLDFVLPAIFSAGDSAKRQIKGLLGDPVGTVKQFINAKNDEAAAHLDDVNLSTQGRMAGLLGVQPTPEQLAADQRWTQALANAYNPAGMIVWHGSPHKFTKFDASKIGTGEGAQAYGHGLYLAESPSVAGEYATMFDKAAPKPTTLMRLRDNAPAGSAEWKHYDDLLQNGIGSLYKVDLPDEHIAKMLDWDKPLSQQAPEVLDALNATKNKQLRAIVDYASSPYSTPGLEGEVKTMGEAIKLLGMNAGNAKGSAMLAKQGIPGIRYLDGGSRGAGQGTSNFVVFPGNEGLLTILERNGVPLR